MHTIAQEVRHVLRGLARQPGLTLGAIAALALGIGATTTMFSIVHGATRDLPFARANQLMAITSTAPRRGLQQITPWVEDFNYWKREQKSFGDLGAYYNTSFNLSAPGTRPEQRPGAWLTPNTFVLLGVQPVQGRAFTEADARAGAPAVVLISHELWQARFAGAPDIVGRTIRLDGAEATVIGVMQRGFGFPVSARLWRPLGTDPVNVPALKSINVFGRLRDGVSRDQASAEFALLARQLERANPEPRHDRSARVFPFVEIEAEPTVRYFLYLMLGAVSFVLLIACANVTNLLLARAATKAREVAIRSALGAGRARLIRQQLIESMAIALAGGVLGLAAARAGVSFFARAATTTIEAFWMQFRVDYSVLGFSAALTMLAAVAAGLIPALRAARTDPGAVLKGESHALSSLRMSRFSRALVVAQVALACGLMATASIFVQSALELRRVPFAFTTRDVVTAQVGFPTTLEQAARLRLMRELTDRVAQMPGVQSTAFMSALPGRGAGSIAFTRTNAPQENPPYAGFVVATPGFLAVLQSRVLRGRDFSWGDNAVTPLVMLVNQSWVNSFSAARDPIGERIRVLDRDYTIVGIVPDLQMQDVQEHGGAGMYVPAAQGPFWAPRMIARVTGDPESYINPLRDAIESVNSDLPLIEPMSLYDAIYSDKKILDVFGILFASFGVGALLLTITGLYGVISFSVTSRTREFGIRRALGARSTQLIGMVVKQGARHLAIGFAIGSAIAFAIGQGAAHTVDFITGVDPRAYVIVIISLAGTGLGALYSPAQRASRIHPMQAMRE